MTNLGFTEDAKCISADSTMLPGYNYTDLADAVNVTLPPGYNPLGESREDITRVIKHWQETSEIPKWAVKKAKMRPAEAADIFGTGKTVDRDHPFIGVVEEDPEAGTDLTDRAPRRPMPKGPEVTIADGLITAVTTLIEVRARLIALAQMAEHGTDVAKTPEARRVFEEIESEAKLLAVTIEAPADMMYGEED